jgi:hypothetical protein
MTALLSDAGAQAGRQMTKSGAINVRYQGASGKEKSEVRLW